MTRTVSHLRRTAAVGSAVALALGGVLLAASPAQAATFDVTSLADDGGAGTLRAAIANANGTDGVDVINIVVPGTITLTSQLTVTDGIELVGLGLDEVTGTTITRSAAFDLLNFAPLADVPAADRVLTIDGVQFDGTSGAFNGRGLLVDDSSQLVSDVTISGSQFERFDHNGGELRAVTIERLDGGLTIDGGSEFLGNDITGNAGGAVYVANADFVRVSDTLFEANSAVHGGGALFTWSVPAVEITRGNFDGNETTNNRGGAYAASGTVTVTVVDSDFTFNEADIAGGAIAGIDQMTLNVSETEFVNNAAPTGGAIYLDGTTADETIGLTVENSIFKSNEATSDGGGAIAIDEVGDDSAVSITTTEVLDSTTDENGALWIGVLDGALTVDSSTFARNAAEIGSGIQIEDARVADGITIVQSTFDEPGTAIALIELGGSGGGGWLHLDHSTVVGVTGLYIGANNSGQSLISNSIVQGTDEFDVFIDGQFPLEVPAEWSVFAHPLDPDAIYDEPGSGNQFGVDPQLAALAENGGPTQTRLPAQTSPAINRGDPAFVAPPQFDQRGDGFDRVIGGRIDVGAVELAAPTSPTLAATGVTGSPWVLAAAVGSLLLGTAALLARRRRTA